MTWKVKFFRTAKGNYPVKEFIEKQDKKAYARIIRTIELLENYGPFMRVPHSKKVRNKLYELRIIGKKSIRIFYTRFNNQYYLVHAFKKKSQKTPKQELGTALDRIKELA